MRRCCLIHLKNNSILHLHLTKLAMVKAGKLGRKSGQGFYTYDGKA